MVKLFLASFMQVELTSILPGVLSLGTCCFRLLPHLTSSFHHSSQQLTPNHNKVHFHYLVFHHFAGACDRLILYVIKINLGLTRAFGYGWRHMTRSSFTATIEKSSNAQNYNFYRITVHIKFTENKLEHIFVDLFICCFDLLEYKGSLFQILNVCY